MTQPGDKSISPFTRRVLNVIDQIPAGRVMSYGAIGDRVGGSARQVGHVMTTCAEETHWHRSYTPTARPPPATPVVLSTCCAPKPPRCAATAWIWPAPSGRGRPITAASTDR